MLCRQQAIVATALAVAKTTVSAFFLSIGLILSGAHPALANDLVGQEGAIINRTNQVRAEAGLPALNTDSRLMRSATAKAVDMATKGYFGHTNSDGHKMNYWITPEGYVYSLAGENIAKGFHSLDRLMNAWITSPTHYKNLVEPRFTDIGVGMATGWYEDQETLFIVQHFGVEATKVAKDIGTMTALFSPLIEDVAGAVDSNTNKAYAQSEPVVPLTVNSPIRVAIESSVPATIIQTAQASPMSTSKPNELLWPFWAILMLATIGYVSDTEFLLMIKKRFSRPLA